MFVALKPLLAAGAGITAAIVGEPDGRIRVTVIPKSTHTGDGAIALNTPLQLTGTAEELDAEFAPLLTRYTEKHLGLAEQMESTAAILDAAKKASADKAGKALAKANSGAASVTEEGGEEEVELAQSAASEPAPAAPAAAVAEQNIWN